MYARIAVEQRDYNQQKSGGANLRARKAGAKLPGIAPQGRVSTVSTPFWE
jgi:hypothetical protein